MTVEYTPPTFSGGIPSATKLNKAFKDVEEALKNALNKNEVSDNEMEADLDMNSHKIINVGKLNGSFLTEDDLAPIKLNLLALGLEIDQVEDTIATMQQQIISLDQSGSPSNTDASRKFDASLLGLSFLESPNKTDFVALANLSSVKAGDVLEVTTPLGFIHYAAVLFEGDSTTKTVGPIQIYKPQSLNISSLPNINHFRNGDTIVVDSGNEVGSYKKGAGWEPTDLHVIYATDLAVVDTVYHSLSQGIPATTVPATYSHPETPTGAELSYHIFQINVDNPGTILPGHYVHYQSPRGRVLVLPVVQQPGGAVAILNNPGKVIDYIYPSLPAEGQFSGPALFTVEGGDRYYVHEGSNAHEKIIASDKSSEGSGSGGGLTIEQATKLANLKTTTLHDIIASNFVASSGNEYRCDTRAQSIAGSVANGLEYNDRIVISDYYRACGFGTTITMTGLIDGQADKTETIDTTGGSIIFTWVDNVFGWRAFRTDGATSATTSGSSTEVGSRLGALETGQLTLTDELGVIETTQDQLVIPSLSNLGNDIFNIKNILASDDILNAREWQPGNIYKTLRIELGDYVWFVRANEDNIDLEADPAIPGNEDHWILTNPVIGNAHDPAIMHLATQNSRWIQYDTGKTYRLHKENPTLSDKLEALSNTGVFTEV